MAPAIASAAVLLLTALTVLPASAEDVAPRATVRSEQSVPLTFNQGIARIKGGWILSGTNSPLEGTDVLVRTDEQFHVLAVNQGAIPPQWRTQGYDHIGDIDVVGDIVYAPFEQPDYTKGHQVTARYDASTLAFRDAVVLPQHQNSFVAVDPATMVAYTMDEFEGDSLLRYDVAHGWRAMPSLPMSMLLHNTQGASVRDGFLWMCTSDPNNDLFRISLKTGRTDNIGHLGHAGGEGEGIDATPLPSGYLHAMVIDPSMTTVWVQHFDLSPSSPSQTGGPAGSSVPPSQSGPNRPGSLPASGGRPPLLPLGGVALIAATVLRSSRRRFQKGQ